MTIAKHSTFTGKVKLIGSSKLRYEDMNASTGGVARGTSIGTTFTSIYSYSGQGNFLGFIVNLEKPDEDWYIRIVVDGEEITGSAGILTSDILDKDIYGFQQSGGKVFGPGAAGIKVAEKAISFDFPQAIPYSSSVQMLVRRASGSKDFRAGLAILTKDS